MTYQPIASATTIPGFVGLPADQADRGRAYCRLPGFVGLPATAPVLRLEPPHVEGQVLRFTRPTPSPLAYLPIGA